MNYELAKKLKDTGFPQHDRTREMGSTGTCNGGCFGGACNPSLSELIEACHPEKSDDFGLSLQLDRWMADYFYSGFFEHHKKFKKEDGSYSVDLHVYGQTPEEAVAELWLTLNEK